MSASYLPATQSAPASEAASRPPEASPLVVSLASREQYRDDYWRKHDPIVDDRLLWRAQTFRHTVHLLPGQTILELGCGELRLTRALVQVSRKENPITAVTFRSWPSVASDVFPDVELIQLHDFPGALAGRQFDCIIAMDMLDRRTSSALLSAVYDLLAPGGEMVFYESNPWNPVYKLKALFSRALGKRDARNLIDRPGLYELLSEIGFIRTYAVFNDFVFAPLTRPLIWLLRNLSILLENAPLVRRMAGSILVHAQKPPRLKRRSTVSLFAHESLRQAVSIVIPCHNEESNIESLVALILQFYGEYISEIILVNDGSTDRTAEVMSQLAAADNRVKPVHRSPPNGVGRAIADGLAQTSGRYVFTMDADFQHLLPEFRELFDAAAEGYDLVIGSRFSRHSVLLNYPFTKIFANRAFHLLAAFIFRKRIRDVTNNLKLMRQEVAANLQLHEPGFAVNAETGLEPLLLGYTVAQVPISWINRTPGMGESSFSLVNAGGGYWRVLFGLWSYHVFGSGPYRSLRKRIRAANDRNELPKQS